MENTNNPLSILKRYQYLSEICNKMTEELDNRFENIDEIQNQKHLWTLSGDELQFVITITNQNNDSYVYKLYKHFVKDYKQ